MHHLQPVAAAHVYESTLAHLAKICYRENYDAIYIKIESLLHILSELEVDEEANFAAILYCFSPFNDAELIALKSDFSTTILSVFQGVERVEQLSEQMHRPDITQTSQSKVNDENLRRMLITMVDDVRVVLIKLADHLLRLREAKSVDLSMQQCLGQLTLDIYAPLANRLGIWQVKWEIEDYALRYLKPETYKNLAATVAEKRMARESYISSFMDRLHYLMSASNLYCEIYGRPKHLYSIYKKMQNKGLQFDSLWDLRAVRILVTNVSECYSALGIVHTTWRHIPGEFDDYIATPKKNGYRSIHTVVIGPDDKSVEVQIRTFEMHKENELGVAAHWRYKENRSHDAAIDNKVLWLRQLLEWKEELLENQLNEQGIADQFDDQRVFVLTPKGRVIDLPANSTPIDFAYSIHTEVGHRVRGARINGKMSALDTKLKSGDQIEVLTTREGGPSRDWLREDLKYIGTNKARNRILHWFKQKDQVQHISTGRNMLEKELNRLGIDDLAYEKIAQNSPYQKVDDLLAALGAGDFKLSKALSSFKRHFVEPDIASITVKKSAVIPKKPKSLQVQGVGNLMTHIANCCAPLPGDPIIGYITQGKGVTIHRIDCNNIEHLDDEHRNRLVDVKWGIAENETHHVDIEVLAYHRNHLLHDVTDVLKKNDINIIGMNMQVNDEQIAKISLQLGISGLLSLSKVTAKLSSIQNVLNVKRITK